MNLDVAAGSVHHHALLENDEPFIIKKSYGKYLHEHCLDYHGFPDRQHSLIFYGSLEITCTWNPRLV